MIHNSNGLQLVSQVLIFSKCLYFSHPQVAIVISVAIGPLTSLLARGYYDWVRLPLPNVAHAQS
jgi:hypothetical protein